MARTISIGAQGFEELRLRNNFYVDKTDFVRDWWESDDKVTIVCRPRRFGKTLNLDTVRCFLSTEFANRGKELFGGLKVWEGGTSKQRANMHALQGTVPVVALSFARTKEPTYGEMLRSLCQEISRACHMHDYLLDWECLREGDRYRLASIRDDMDALTCANAINVLCDLLKRYYGVAPVVLLDEYDAPMELAWTSGYWEEAAGFMRRLMNSTFKTNPALGRGLMTGVTRVSRESIFSDLNNLEVITTSAPKYQTAFGFTQKEVDAALHEYGMFDEREGVQRWYDGFVFDGVPSIYNPWSITKFLESGGYYDTYWANTSGNRLVSEVTRRGDRGLKHDFEVLLAGGELKKIIDEQVVFSELDTHPNAVWSLLLAAGYLTSPGPVPKDVVHTPRKLRLTNLEVEATFDRMVEGWFGDATSGYDEFCQALLRGDARAATRCLEEVAEACMSSFDAARNPGKSEPERFYHGLVLGMLVKLRGRYSVESNRESGFGRYDIALVPTDGARGSDPAVVIEFKVFDARYDGERTLDDTVARAHEQIRTKDYVAGLVARGIAPERIRVYGIAFRGKDVLVG